MNNLRVGDLALVIGANVLTDLIGRECEVVENLGVHKFTKLGEKSVCYAIQFSGLLNKYGTKEFIFRARHLMKISPDDTVKEKEKSVDYV